MSHIFISYSHEDYEFAENLLHNLRGAGFTPWRDVDELRAGEVWRVEIDQAIKDALAMLVIMTPVAKNSEYVTYEWAFALGVGVKVIPIMLKRTELHPRLGDIQFLDFTGRIRPWPQLIETVQEVADIKDKDLKDFINRNAPPYIKRAIISLDSSNPADREGAIEFLVKDINTPVGQKAMTIALNHQLKEIRFKSSLAIARFPDMQVQALPSLFEALYDSRYNEKAV
jgi:hypothetical protein